MECLIWGDGDNMEIYNNTYCVYIHINKINGKKYIGQTIYGDNPNFRWKNGAAYQTQKYFWRAIQKYGWDGFDHEVVASNLTKEEANNFEILLIEKFNTTNSQFGYNITLGGGGALGRHPTEEQINKQKEAMRRYYDDEKYIQNMRDVAPKRIVHQFTLSGEFIATYISAMEAQRQTGIHNGDISKCAFGRTTHTGNYIFLFDEDRDKINQRIEKYNNSRKLRKEPIVQLSLSGEYIAKWKGPSDAGKNLNISYKNIHAVCRNKRTYAGGFKWMYLSDYIQLCKDVY